MYKMRMNPPQKYQAERDVAFTSDERWLVTERDGMPTLVDAETGANLQRYDIGALFCQRQSNPHAQAAVAAGDDGEFAGK